MDVGWLARRMAFARTTTFFIRWYVFDLLLLLLLLLLLAFAILLLLFPRGTWYMIAILVLIVELRAPNALAPKTLVCSLALTLLQKITCGFSDDPGFAEFMRGFNKSYKVPTRQRVAQMAIQRYASQREVLADALKELEVRPVDAV
jgi:hypothetical protein